VGVKPPPFYLLHFSLIAKIKSNNWSKEKTTKEPTKPHIKQFARTTSETKAIYVMYPQ